MDDTRDSIDIYDTSVEAASEVYDWAKANMPLGKWITEYETVDTLAREYRKLQYDSKEEFIEICIKAAKMMQMKYRYQL